MARESTHSIAEYRKRIFLPSYWNAFFKDVLLPSCCSCCDSLRGAMPKKPSESVAEYLNRRNEAKKRIDDSFELWLETFIVSEVLIGAGRRVGMDIKAALQKTCQLDVTGTTALLSKVLTACYQAKHASLPEEHRRKGNSEFLQECSSQNRALKKITKFMKRYPEACSEALMGGGMPWLGDRGYEIGITEGEGMPLSLATLAGLLDFYAVQLKKGVGGRKRGPWLYRWKAGPLLYPDSRPLDKQKAQPDPRVNGLLFELTFHFRWHTTSGFNGNYGGGTLMPTGGNPHFNLVALLTHATLGKELSADAVRSRVESLPKGVILTEW